MEGHNNQIPNKPNPPSHPVNRAFFHMNHCRADIFPENSMHDRGGIQFFSAFHLLLPHIRFLIFKPETL
jgi:hypothetical protein